MNALTNGSDSARPAADSNQTEHNQEHRPRRNRTHRSRGKATGHAAAGGHLSDSAVTEPTPNSSHSGEGSNSRGRTNRNRGRGRGRGARSANASAAQSSRSVSPSSDHSRHSHGDRPYASRRAKFGSKVTESNGVGSQDTSRSNRPRLQQPAEDSSLQARLSFELLNGTAECVICISNIGANSSTHSCPVCSAITHLNCISKWATRSVDETQQRANLLSANATAATQIPPVQWRCPSCQSTFPPFEIPKVYRCFCGRVTNPPKPRSPNVVPHSCGEGCRKARPLGCAHRCPSLCHPGPCEPCTATIDETCYCGKDVKRLKCADVHPERIGASEKARSCGQTCDKVLACGLHKCTQACHFGDCPPCLQMRTKKCYCGRDEISELCATPEHPAQDRYRCFSSSDDITSWDGEYACLQDCRWTYDCGVHFCDHTCHPHTSIAREHCQKSPDSIANCPCGKTPLTAYRQACTDPIPTCGQMCGKTLEGCSHVCQELCHDGSCPPCSQQVSSVCRCGNEKRSTVCSTLKQEQAEFTCHRICRAMRHCGRHVCGNKCCPLAFQESFLAASRTKGKSKATLAEAAVLEDPHGIHTCPLICGRLLSCGIHNCERNDHRGPCGRCLASEFSEISCYCGGTVLMPPVPCGTRIKCELPCSRPPPACGHPKVPHTCHEDASGCPPCSFLVEKPCQCAKRNIVKNVRCSQEKVSCGVVCGNLLACGAHRCRLGCHVPGECEEPCSQICGKARKLCGHPHEAPCHAPSACSTAIPCPVMVDVTCACGNVRQRAVCGACSARPSPAASKLLPCSDVCALNKRNAALAEALGIDSRAASPKLRPTVAYDQSLIEFYLDHQVWAKEIEGTFCDFMRSPKQTHLFQPMKQPQREFLHELAELWSFRSESLDAEPHRSVHITKRASSAQPANSLTDAAAQLRRPPVKAEEKAKLSQGPQANALYFTAVFGMDKEALHKQLSSLCTIPFDLYWTGEEDVLFVPRVDAGLTGTALYSKLTNLKESISFTPAITITGGVDLCHRDSSTGQVTWRQSWQTTGNQRQVNSNANGTVNRWSKPLNSALKTTNAFDALGGPVKDKRQDQPSGSSQQRFTTVGGGLYRPPAAVLVNPQGSPIVEDWEHDTLE